MCVLVVLHTLPENPVMSSLYLLVVHLQVECTPLSSITQPEIGRLLGGIDYSAVSQARKRLHIKIQNEPAWEKKFNQIQGKLSQMSRVKI
jgi:hypothetical protein